MDNINKKVFGVVFVVILAVMLAIPSFSQDFDSGSGWITIYEPSDEESPSGRMCLMVISARTYGVPMPAIRKISGDSCDSTDTQVSLLGLLVDGGIAFGIATVIAVALQRKKSTTG